MPPRRTGRYTIQISAGTRLYVNKEFTPFMPGDEVTILEIKRETMKFSNGAQISWRLFLNLLKNGTFSITLIAPY